MAKSVKVNINTKSMKTLRKQLDKYLLSVANRINGKSFYKFQQKIESGKRKTLLKIYDTLKTKLSEGTDKLISFKQIKEQKVKDTRRIAVYGHFDFRLAKNQKHLKRVELIDVIKVPKTKNIQQYIEEKYRPAYENEQDYYSSNIKTLEKLTYKMSSVSEVNNLTIEQVPMKNAFVLNYNWLKYSEGIAKKSFTDMNGQCVYELLVEHLKPRWTTVTKEDLFKIFNEYYQTNPECITVSDDLDYGTDLTLLINKEFNMSSGVSSKMIQHLCNTKNISMYAFDADEKLFIKRLGDNKYKPIVYYCIDGHMYLINDTKVIKSVSESCKTEKNNINSSLLEDAIEMNTEIDNSKSFVSVKTFDDALKLKDCIAFVPKDDITEETINYVVRTKTAPIIMSKSKHKITSILIKDQNLSICCDLNIVDGLNWETIKKICDTMGIEFKNQTIGTLIHQIKKEYFKPNRLFLTMPQKLELLKKQKNKCNICNTTIVHKFEADHITPLCRGGSNDFSNFQLLCNACHKVKTNEDTDELVKYNSMTSSFNSEAQHIVNSRLFKQWAFVEKLSDKIADVGYNNTHKIDHIKCRRNLVMYNEYDFPVFSVMDYPTKYNKDTIKPGCYYVETNNYFPLRGNGWYPHPLVLYCLEQQIISNEQIKYQFTSSFSLPNNHFKQFAQFLVNITSEIDPKVAKLIVNSMVGCWGITSSSVSKIKLTLDKYYASIKMAKNDKSFVTSQTVDDKVVYQICEAIDIIKDESYLPFYNHIIACEAIELHKLEQIIIKNNGIPLERNTDAILYSGNKIDISNYYYDSEKTSQKYQYEEECKLLKVDSVCKFVRTELYVHNELQWNSYIETDDFDKLTNQIIESNKGCFINGQAGVGKTYLTNMIIKKLEEKKKKLIKLAPTNKATRLIDGKTLHKFYIELNLSKHGEQKIIQNLTNIDFIIVDEASMMHEIFYRMLLLIQKYQPNIKFLVAGDFKQLKPVNDRYTGEYENCVPLFNLCDGNKLVLTKCRRSDKKLFNLYQSENIQNINPKNFRPKQVNFNNLAFTHKTRIQVNDICMKEYIKTHPYYITAKENKHNPKSQKTYIAKDMPIICFNNKLKKENIFNNDMFIIKSVNQKNKTFTFINQNDGVEHTFKHFQFSTYFYPAFCITIHCSQGQTYENNYTIHDWALLDERLKYVALSRAKSFENISII